MKNIILSLSLFGLVFGIQAQGLRTDKSNFKGGLRVGFTASQISGDCLSGFHKLGAYAGGFVNIPVTMSGKWKIQAELNFIMKGSSLYSKGADDPNIGNKYSLNLYYTETPVIVKFNVFKGLEIELGPTFNFLFYHTEKGIDGDLSIIYPAFRIFEFSILAGVSYLFKEHWGVNFRFTNSIIPVRIPNWNCQSGSSMKQFNTVMAISAYYQF